MKLSVYQDGYFVVSAPKWYPLYAINQFILEKSNWILEKLEGKNFFEKEKIEKEDYLKLKKAAREIISRRLEFFNRYYGFSFERVAIRNQRTCWGSCSQKKNLNFNYKIVKLSEELRDYVVVHELCHLEEMNHGRKFWKLVERTLPNWRALRRELKNIKI